MFLDEKGEYSAPTNHVGYLSIGVPGTVAGFFLAHERFGKLPMEELLAPAIELADKGFPVSWRLADRFERLADTFRKYPATAEAFLKEDGEPYQPGEVWKQPDLARTLRRIQKEGRAGFYQGTTARLLAAAMKKHGGLITEEDLAAYEAKERTPVHGTYRRHDVYSMYPPTSGGVALLEFPRTMRGLCDVPSA
jgi:gamma-glutamyltranspeptidase/glutathione hydrolase